MDVRCSLRLLSLLCAGLTGCVSTLDELRTQREEVGSTTTAPSSAVSNSNCADSTCFIDQIDAAIAADAAPGTTPSSSGTAMATDIPPDLTCGPGTFVEMGESGGQCRACAEGSFSTTSGSSECVLWTECQLGQFVERNGTAMQDRRCEECPADETSDTLNAPACTPIECDPGAAREPNVGCVPCEPGSYCPGETEPAAPCDGETWDDDVDPTTPCVSKRTCVTGEWVVDDGASTLDRECAPCTEGSFSATENAVACVELSPCEAGSYVSVAGSSMTDNVCAECPPSTFSATANATACTPWTQCTAPDNRMTVAPDASTDRGCEECTAPYITLEDNESACGLHAFQVVSGEVVIEAENFFEARASDAAAWTELESAGQSNEACMELGPDVGASWTTDPATTAPALHYRVNFSAQGSYYVHVRGDAGANSNGSSDSCFAAIDSTALNYTFNSAGGTWGWVSQSFSVSSAGLHIVSLYGREDGFRADKIVVNTAANPPTGLGPEASDVDPLLVED